MASLFRLSKGSTPPTEPEITFQPPFASEYDEGPQYLSRVKKWWRTHVRGEREPESPSGYLTLIPLNDSRLKPQRTALLVILLLIFAVIVATGTFFLVPRGVSLGEISVQTEHRTWNFSEHTYKLNLIAQIPVNNPNYLSVRIDGKLSMYFYDIEAGSHTIMRTRIPPRSSPHMLEAVVDASNVPTEYVLAILAQCDTFPKRLVFFLKGSFTARYLAQSTSIGPMDTYFIIDCFNGGKVMPKPGRNPPPPLLPPPPPAPPIPLAPPPPSRKPSPLKPGKGEPLSWR